MVRSLTRTCGQLIVGGYLEAAPSASFLAALAKGERAGAILFRRNLPDVASAYESCRQLQQAAGSQPLWIAIDQEGGCVARLRAPVLELPPMMRLGALDDEALIEQAAGVVGRELLALGFNLDFAPVLDVHTNERNPVIGDRAFGCDAQQVATLGWAFARGLMASGVGACGKHFPGHGDTDIDSHLALPAVSSPLERMRQLEWVPFARAIEAGLPAIMTAHVVCQAIEPALPATLSSVMLGHLRHELGFHGVVFSDDLEMRAIAAHWPIDQAAVLAVRAGCDAVLICSNEQAQDQALEALVHQAERDSDFRRTCEQACERTTQMRRRFPCKPERTVHEAVAKLQSAEAQALRARWQPTS